MIIMMMMMMIMGSHDLKKVLFNNYLTVMKVVMIKIITSIDTSIQYTYETSQR